MLQNIKDIPQGEYEDGFKHGAQSLAIALISSIDEGESEGIPFSSQDYKKVIQHILQEIGAARNTAKIITN